MLNVQDIKYAISVGVSGANKVEALRKDIQALDGAGDKLSRSFQGVMTAAPKAFTVALVAAAGAAALASREAINLGDDLNDLSQKTGIAVETLAGFKVAAEASGLQLESLAGSVNKLSKSIVEALDGTGKQADAFDALGVKLKTAEGVLRPTNEILLEMADRFKDIPDGAGKAALAMAIFGKSGADMIPFLNQGSEEIKKFTLNITQEFASKADAFNDAMGVTNNRLIEFGAKAIEPLLPLLTSAAEGMGEFVKAMTAVTGPAAEGFAEVTNAIGEAMAALLDTVKVFDSVFQVSDMLAGGLDLIAEAFKGMSIAATSLLYVVNRLLNGLGGLADLAKTGFTQVGQWVGVVDKNRNVGQEGWNALNQRAAQANAIDAEAAARLQSIVNGGRPGRDASGGRSNGTGNVDLSSFAEKNDEIDKFIQKQKEAMQATRDEMAMIGKTAYEIQRLKTARDIDNQAAQVALKLSGDKKAAFLETVEAIKKERLELMDLANAQARTFGAGARAAFAEYIDNATNAAQQAKNLFSNAFKNMEDMLVDFVMTGKANFKEFARAIIADIVRIQIQTNVITPLVKGIGSLLPDFSMSSASVTTAANGAVMTPYGPMPLQAYDKGGIARHKQMAIYGEGHLPEAIVPLPDGRSIPVRLHGGAGNSVAISITVNGDGITIGSNGNEPFWQQVSVRVAQIVKDMMADEKRAGGMFSPAGAF